MNRNWLGEVMIATLVAATFLPRVAPHSPSSSSCAGLHAGIRAEVVPSRPGFTQPPYVMISLVLLNDSDVPINATAGGWTILIDGKEVADSDLIFGNGPQPGNGWGVLNPGESYDFGKGLDLAKYFPVARDYQVSWKGNTFRSSTISVTVPKTN
jgi:hypothetical protein